MPFVHAIPDRAFTVLYALQERLTIRTGPPSTDTDVQSETMALGVLGWVLQDAQRAERLLALTGLTPESLRAGVDERQTQVAILDFVCGHEPDLLAAAEALDVEPGELPAARERLAR